MLLLAPLVLAPHLAMAPPIVHILELDASAPPGLSDLTPVPDTDPIELFAVPERTRTVIQVLLDPGHVTRAEIGARLTLTGVKTGEDTESIAFFDKEHVLFGTETDKERKSDVLLVADRSKTGIAVQRRISLSYKSFQMKASPNHGIEALCVAGDRLIAGSESFSSDAEGRFAPLWELDKDLVVRRTGKLRLTSATGKLSGLSCRRDGDLTRFLAIERHYEVIRVLSFTWAREGNAGPSGPDELADLKEALGPKFNPEGIIELKVNRFLLIADNDTGGARGPSRLADIEVQP